MFPSFLAYLRTLERAGLQAGGITAGRTYLCDANAVPGSGLTDSYPAIGQLTACSFLSAFETFTAAGSAGDNGGCAGSSSSTSNASSASSASASDACIYISCRCAIPFRHGHGYAACRHDDDALLHFRRHMNVLDLHCMSYAARDAVTTLG